jgi:hypothetical protein
MSQEKFSVQVRGDDIRNVATFQEALAMSKKDPTIWKISFSLPTGERIRLVKNDQGQFFYEPILPDEEYIAPQDRDLDESPFADPIEQALKESL